MSPLARRYFQHSGHLSAIQRRSRLTRCSQRLHDLSAIRSQRHLASATNPLALRHLQHPGHRPAIRFRPMMRSQRLHRRPANRFQRPRASVTNPRAPHRLQRPRLQPASLPSPWRDQRARHRPRVQALWFRPSPVAVSRSHPAPSLAWVQHPPTSPGSWSGRSSWPGRTPWCRRNPRRLSRHRQLLAHREGAQRAQHRSCRRRPQRRPTKAHAGDSPKSRPWHRASPTGQPHRPSVGLSRNRHCPASPTDRARRSPHRCWETYRFRANPRDPALQPGPAVVRPCGGGFRPRGRPTDPTTPARRHECRRPRRSDPRTTARRRLRQGFAERRKSCPGGGSAPLRSQRTSRPRPAG